MTYGSIDLNDGQDDIPSPSYSEPVSVNVHGVSFDSR